MKANFFTQPAEVNTAGYQNPQVYITVRLWSWKIDSEGIHRWWKFIAAKPNKLGRCAERYGWKTIYLFRK